MATIVLGAAGFLGSTIVDRLVGARRRVIAVDDLSTGRLENLDWAISTGRASFLYADVALDCAVVAETIERIAPTLDRSVIVAGPTFGAATRLATMLNIPIAAALAPLHDDADGSQLRSSALFDTRGAFGPRMRLDETTAQQRIFSALLHGRPLPVRGVEGRRVRFAYSKDLADAVIAEPGDGAGANRVNTDYGVDVSLREIVEIIGDVLGHPVRTVTADPADISLSGDPDAAVSRAQRVRLADGIRATCQWHRASRLKALA